ncbi:MAG: hypothetical protein QF685_08060 [Verrucomicrobiota bacterium]|jgi:regulator of protease activity HflC (stomatin/prohibitin superfamily)|nr:hypothetical protein [Verrucomicrobiota bacterium]
MDNKIKGAGWWNTGIAFLALGAGVFMLLESRTGAPAPAACFVLAFLVVGFLVALVSSFHLQLLDREKQEQLEYEETTSGSEDSSMFEGDAFAARRTREQFDRWIVPLFTGFLLLLEVGVVYFIVRSNSRFYDFAEEQVLDGAGVMVAISAVFGMFLFLRGRYATLLSRKVNALILQPGSDFLLLGAYLFFLLAAVSAAAMLEYPLVHQYLAVGLCIFMGILAFETLLRLILEKYRPRMKGQEVRQLYHSRLVGLISKPEGFFTTAAHALDYQFGFKVSETWGYRFLRERLALLVLLQVFVLWLSSGVVIIPQSQVGYLERLGKPIDGNSTVGPGINFTLPWPIDRVERYFEDEVRMLYIGPELDPKKLGGRSFFWYDDDKGQMVSPAPPFLADVDGDGKPDVLQHSRIWKEPNVRDYDKQHLVRKKILRTYFATRFEPLGTSLAKMGIKPQGNDTEEGGDVEALLFAGVFVQFRIGDVAKYANYAVQPESVLEKLVVRQLTRHFLESDARSILMTHRGKLAEDIRAKVQEKVNEIGLGLDVLYVGLDGVQPPNETAMMAVQDEKQPDKTEDPAEGSPVEKYEDFFAGRILQLGSDRLSKLRAESLRRMSLIEQTKLVTLGQLEAEIIGYKAGGERQREDDFFKLYSASQRVYPAFQLIDARTNYLGSIENKIVLIGVDAEGYEVDLKQGGDGLLGDDTKISVGGSNK